MMRCGQQMNLFAEQADEGSACLVNALFGVLTHLPSRGSIIAYLWCALKAGSPLRVDVPSG